MNAGPHTRRGRLTYQLATQDEILAACGAEASRRAMGKRSGGAAGAYGYRNEWQCGAYLVVALIMLSMRSPRCFDDPRMYAQTGEFVDDFSFWIGRCRYHVQAKGGHGVTWKADEEALRLDFERQATLDRYRGIQSRSILAVSSDRFRSLRKLRPASLPGALVLAFDPIFQLDDLSDLHWRMLDRVLEFCPFANDRASAFDALTVLADVVGNLHANQPESVGSILLAADRRYNGVIVDPRREAPIASDVFALLTSVPDFAFVVSGDTLHYQIEGDHGRSPFSWKVSGADFEDAVRRTKPMNVDELFPLLRGRWT